MNLLILHLQNVFQALQVLLDVFIWCQSILATADNISENHYRSLKPINKAFFISFMQLLSQHSSQHDVLYCVVPQLPLSAHLCSGAELLRNAWLCLWGYDSETSACPPDPGDHADINLLNTVTNHNMYPTMMHLQTTTVYLQRQSDLFKLFLQRLGLLFMGHLQIWQEK